MIILDARFERSEARHPLFPYPVWEFKEAGADSQFFDPDKQAPILRSIKRQLGQLKATLATKKENDDTVWPEDYTLKRFTIIEGMMVYFNAGTANKNPAKRLKDIDALFQTIYAAPLLDDFVEPNFFRTFVGTFAWNTSLARRLEQRPKLLAELPNSTLSQRLSYYLLV